MFYIYETQEANNEFSHYLSFGFSSHVQKKTGTFHAVRQWEEDGVPVRFF